MAYIATILNEIGIKPNCRLIGENGNIYNLMGIAAKTLKESSMTKQATEMCGRIINSGSYAEALNIVGEYVNIYPRAKTSSNFFQSFRSRATLVGAKSEFLFAP